MNVYQKYQTQMVTTMTQGESLLMLYDGAIKQIDIGRNAIEASNIEEMDTALKKAERIVRYLRSILDEKYTVSSSLAKLYDFFNIQLVMANVKKDVKPLDEIRPLILELRDTFEQCNKISRVGRGNASVGNMV